MFCQVFCTFEGQNKQNKLQNKLQIWEIQAHQN